MYTKYEPRDFSVSVRSKGKAPKPWRWEIHRAGRSSAVEQSSELFPTMAAADKAGKQALAELYKRLHVGIVE